MMISEQKMLELAETKIGHIERAEYIVHTATPYSLSAP
jgi:hypothetical protein